MRRINVNDVALDEPLDMAVFRHDGTAVGHRLGARRIGAGLYVAQAGRPIWPYHYHHGVEEWVWVIAGAPVLREAAGERSLGPGDLVAFPSGPVGAHTMSGPGRFLIFSTGQQARPWLSVYPDSDKLSGPEGILLRSGRVGYWHEEGGMGEQPAAPREDGPAVETPRPVLNVLSARPEAAVAARIGGATLEAALVVLGAGEDAGPYAYVQGSEQWVVVLAGTPAVRLVDGEERLGAGDVLCFAEGPSGAHQVVNRSDAPARVLVLSASDPQCTVVRPEAGTLTVCGAAQESVTFRLDDAVRE